LRRSKIQKRLGIELDAKLLIIHADDVGLCHSANRASFESMVAGHVNSSSVMVTCPWFFEAAKFFQTQPALDVGVHLTISSEWQNYKWGPLLAGDLVPSLVDQHGHFLGHEFHTNAIPEHAYLECKAQIERALEYGLKISHLDCHMNCLVMNKRLFEVYARLGREFNLPIMASREYTRHFGYDIDCVLDKEAVLVSNMYMGQLTHAPQDLALFYDECFASMRSGLNVLLVHPAYNDFELQGITLDCQPFGAQWRQADFDYFVSEQCTPTV